jgi:hypothetical protein
MSNGTNKSRTDLILQKERDMDERVTAHIVGLGISVVYFLCIALAAAALM